LQLLFFPESEKKEKHAALCKCVLNSENQGQELIVAWGKNDSGSEKNLPQIKKNLACLVIGLVPRQTLYFSAAIYVITVSEANVVGCITIK